MRQLSGLGWDVWKTYLDEQKVSSTHLILSPKVKRCIIFFFFLPEGINPGMHHRLIIITSICPFIAISHPLSLFLNPSLRPIPLVNHHSWNWTRRKGVSRLEAIHMHWRIGSNSLCFTIQTPLKRYSFCLILLIKQNVKELRIGRGPYW